METTRYLSAELMTHDDFNCPFSLEDGEYVFDAKTKHGPWACMSEASYMKHGTGVLGIGYGQVYVRKGPHLYGVAGFGDARVAEPFIREKKARKTVNWNLVKGAVAITALIWFLAYAIANSTPEPECLSTMECGADEFKE